MSDMFRVRLGYHGDRVDDVDDDVIDDDDITYDDGNDDYGTETRWTNWSTKKRLDRVVYSLHAAKFEGRLL